MVISRLCALTITAIGISGGMSVAQTPGSAIAANCTSRGQLAAADAYIAALSDRNKAKDVPFASNAVRYENGLQTGFSGKQLQSDLYLHLQYSVMAAPVIKSKEVGVNGNPNRLRYRFTVPVKIGGLHLIDAPTVEYFRIPQSSCLIERIDATISIAPVK